MAKAEITRWNGAPQLVIDGKPHPPMGYFMKWKDPENHLQHIRQRYDAGQRMFYLGWYAASTSGVAPRVAMPWKTG